MSLRRSAMASKPQYSTLPTNDHDVRGADLQPFELESEHQNDYRSKRQTFAVYTATCSFALLLVMVGYGAYKGGEKTEVPAKSKGGGGFQIEDDVLQDSPDEDLATPTPKYIFCYGDSLTFGMTGMHTKEPGQYPYAEYLEEELNYLYDPAFDNTLTSEYNSSDPETLVPPTLVEHLGLPGWTAEQMLNHKHDQKVGLCSIVHSLPKMSLLIILVGTNDVLQMTESSKDVGRQIISQIIGVHKGAFECAQDAGDEGPKNLHTLALGIPGSAFQEKVPIVKEMTSFINGALKNFASSYEGEKISFLDFPFSYRDGDPKWSEDGIHLTREGYAAMGKELAPRVKDILDGIGSE